VADLVSTCLEPRSRHAERICFEEVLRGRAYLARRTRYSLLVSSSTISLREQDLGRESSEFWWVGNVPSYNLNPDNNKRSFGPMYRFLVEGKRTKNPPS
jgi:hypothetical protein